MNKKPLRLIYMGTPEFAVPALVALQQNPHVEIVAVYTQPPRPSGRGYKVTPSAVHQKAEKLSIPVYYPASLRREEAQKVFQDLCPDVAVVAAYGLILPQAILDIPKHGCFNIHGSLLPRWRGAAPIQRAILAGDKETGITIMKMDAGLDTGDMILWQSTPIEDKTAPILYAELAEMGAHLIQTVIEQLRENTIHYIKQPQKGVTYAQKITKEEGLLDWALPAEILLRQLRAFTPWPGVWFTLERQIIKVLEAEVVPFDTQAHPQTPVGALIDKDLTIACGQNALRLTRVQPAGKPAMDARAFQNGIHLKVGRVLSLAESHA